MKIFLDFDDTIFDRGAFWKKMESVFLEKGVSPKIISESYEKSRKKINKDFSIFNPEKQMDIISKKTSIDRRILEKGAKEVFAMARDYVYADFWKFVAKFKKSELYLISFGDAKFQKDKIRHAGVGKKFKEVIITQKQKIREIKRVVGKKTEEKIIFIDDRDDQIEIIKKYDSSIRCFRIDRKKERSCKTKEYYDYRINSLEEVFGIINH